MLVASVEVLAGASGSAAAPHARGVERASRHVLIVPWSGAGHHVVDFETVEVGVGSVVHVQPGQTHRFAPEPTYRADVVVVEPAACPPGLFHPSCPTSRVPLGPVFDVARAVTADLVAEQSRPDRNDDIMVAAAGLLLRHVARIAAKATERRSAVLDAFLAELEDRFHETRNVAAYARSIGTSTKTLARVTAAIDLTPKDVIDRRVALEAQRCLAATRTPIAEVGRSLGFSEATNFTKFFVRMTGTTPHEFRSQLPPTRR